MALSNNLRKLREQNQYSQAELARSVQVAQSTIAMYETEERVPNAYVLMRLSNFLWVSCEELVGEQTSTKEVQMTEKNFWTLCRIRMHQSHLLQRQYLALSQARNRHAEYLITRIYHQSNSGQRETGL